MSRELAVIPWEQAITTEFDLAISASHTGGLTALRAPLLVLPHGPGYTRKTSVPNSYLGTTDQHLEGLHPFKVTYALSHAEKHSSLPPGANTVITGDPAFDSLSNSVTDRTTYREALGLSDGQKLVVFSSTWGKSSLFGSDPSIFETVMASLPRDEYVIAVILHPNIWIGHGRWQLRLWLRRAREAGLRLIPFEQGWRAAVVAADYIIGDHGSVTFYSAALGRPVWVASYGDEEMMPDTPLTDFGQQAPRLDHVRDIRQTIASPNSLVESGEYQQLRDAAFDHQGHALERIRELIYQLLDLGEPPRPVPQQITPPARIMTSTPTANLVVARTEPTTGNNADTLHVFIERYPVWAAEYADLHASHLAVWMHDPDLGLRQTASVLIDALPEGSNIDYAEQALSRELSMYPGTFLVTAATSPRQAIALASDGNLVIVESQDGKPLPADVAGSAIREWKLAGMTAQTMVVSVGTQVWETTVTVLR